MLTLSPSLLAPPAIAAAPRTAGLPERSALLRAVGAGLQVPLIDGSTAEYVNLDVAASAPALTAVQYAVLEATPYYSSVHRGSGYLSQVSTLLYERSRAAVGAFVGARSDDQVIFTRNTTDALNLLATAVPGPVLVLDIEHHANLLPWRRGDVSTVAVKPTVAETLDELVRNLNARRYALLAVTGLSNVTGEALPLATVAELAHAFGARLAVDGAQLVAHAPVDIAGTGIDYLALSGHKLYAPYGCGALIGRADWLDAAPPYLAGGGAVRRVERDAVSWTTGAARHEAGSPNALGAIALAAACETFGGLAPAAWRQHEASLTSRLRAGLAGIAGLQLARLWPDSQTPSGIVTFTVPGLSPEVVAAALSAEFGIGVRDGRFCAHPLLARLGLAGGAVRASLGVHSSSADVDRLVEAVAALCRYGPQASYQPDAAGNWVPVPDPRRLPPRFGGGPLAGQPARPCRADRSSPATPRG
ncbi:MAG TPA: aminotransferase class V-fold PLP-dependent enzyme [Jatrophihabitans sp.]|nr:aminotransferase class V-fold PLP-dependent enzyme [Jatrophihabitans sp.]